MAIAMKAARDGDGEARFDVVLEEARVVRQVLSWVGQDRCSIGEVCRRLNEAREQTRTGKTVWDRATVWDMLKNPAYKGAAAFGKTSVEPLRPRLREQRGRPMQPKRAVSTQDVPREKWMSISVPALVDEAVFETVQEQLQENQQRARIGQRGARYLLQGLLVWARYAGMLTMASPLAQVRAKAIHAALRIIVASVPMPTALVACVCAGTSNSVLISSMRQCGTKSASYWKIPRGWNRNIGNACLPKRVPPNLLDLKPVWDDFDKALPG
jgi:recombinase